jgi:hypothetical protein
MFTHHGGQIELIALQSVRIGVGDLALVDLGDLANSNPRNIFEAPATLVVPLRVHIARDHYSIVAALQMEMNSNELGQESRVFKFKMFRLNVNFNVFPVAGTPQKFCGIDQQPRERRRVACA